MNRRQLEKLGIPAACAKLAVTAVAQAASQRGLKQKQLRAVLLKLLDDPASYVADPDFGPLAEALLHQAAIVPREPIEYRTWGQDIDDGAHQQMHTACRVPMAVGAALMPDAHVGYGLPIGGVLALEGAVIPYAVGVDIACRMKLSVLDASVESLEQRFPVYRDALERETRFGIGSQHERPQNHPVMDQDWTVTRITRERKDKAWRQLGSSGSGNHFVEFGVLSVPEADNQLGLAAGQYVALLSHSGSRGVGAAVCDVYSKIARRMLPEGYQDLGRLAWLSMDEPEGQEYWAAMSLMGDYAAANHEVIHRLVTRRLGVQVLAGVENHHNYAWQETHYGRQVIVHRKGATPAGTGVLGVIPGSMADPAFVVRGRGNPASMDSASHGAGRCMSRRAAKARFAWSTVRKQLAEQGIQVLSAGADEVPGVYKNIEQVMRDQRDLVEVVARFDPRIVKMCGDGSRAED